MPDELSQRYGDLLDGSYDCVDRIVLNGYFRLCYSGGGFREWWRRLMGSEEKLDNAHLMRMAGRFSRRVRGSAKAHGIPVIDCRRGERKHEIAEEYLATHTVKRGLFLILVARAIAPVWDVQHWSSGAVRLAKKTPYVKHYSFHILDPDWGHITIKMAGHPPFGAQIILNGHEYVACQARKAHLTFTKDSNCFYPHHQRRAPGEDRRHPGRRAGHRAADPGLRTMDLFHVFVLCAGLGRARAHRIPLLIFGLPGRIQPQPPVPFRRSDGGPFSAHVGSHAGAAGRPTAAEIIRREETPVPALQTNVRTTACSHARDA